MNLPIEKHLELLGNNQSFLAFLDYVYAEMRESEVRSLRRADKEEVLKIAGRIDAFDEVLEFAKHSEIKSRFASL